MKRLSLVAASAVTAALCMSGTADAAAFPVKDPKLTKNALYESGRLAKTKCALPKSGSAKPYITKLVGCLNAAWGPKVKKAGFGFAKPTLKFVTKKPKKFCGHAWDSQDVLYCPDTRTLQVLQTKGLNKFVDDLYLLDSVGLEYALHIQTQTGINDAYLHLPAASDKEGDEQVSRLLLQTTCLSAVFVKSAWSSLGHTSAEWKAQLRVTKAGGGANAVYWAKRGYAGGDPGSCDTWSASSSKV